MRNRRRGAIFSFIPQIFLAEIFAIRFRFFMLRLRDLLLHSVISVVNQIKASK